MSFPGVSKETFNRLLNNVRTISTVSTLEDGLDGGLYFEMHMRFGWLGVGC